LRKYYDGFVLPLSQDYVVTYNLGIPSDTSTGVAQRFTAETQARLSPNPDVENYQFIIAIGTNDSRWLLNEEKHGVDKAQFKTNLEDITVQATAFSSDITFVGLPPIVDEVLAKTAQRSGWDSIYKNSYVEAYNHVLKQHCIDHELDFIDLNKRFENESIESLFDDGIHPNTEGHALIFDYIVNHLNERTSKTQ